MIYKNVVKGIFLKRPNRFIAIVLINGVEEIVHVKNTGRCKELLIEGVTVILEPAQNINRKTKFSLISVYKGDTLINIDSSVPNEVVFEAIKQGKIVDFIPTFARREKTFGNSRFDIYFEQNILNKETTHKWFMEVKGVTLINNNIAMFPDAPTERGTKHLKELVEAKNQGYNTAAFFLIQMKGATKFMPNKLMDKNFTNALIYAKENGVILFAYDSIVEVDKIVIGNPIEILL